LRVIAVSGLLGDFPVCLGFLFGLQTKQNM
jgi:hypothetical protein